MECKRITLRDIAGFCPEEAVWKMMADVTLFLVKDNPQDNISPEAIIVDGNKFILEVGHVAEIEFLAPELEFNQISGPPQNVWTLGALAYYLVTGHIIFGGHGGIYQKKHASVALPIMPKGFHALTSVLHKCLCPYPEERISLEELSNLVQKGLTTCEKQERMRIAKNNIEIKNKYHGDRWPEKMIEI